MDGIPATETGDNHHDNLTRAVPTGFSPSTSSLQQNTPPAQHPKHDRAAQAADAASDQPSSSKQGTAAPQACIANLGHTADQVAIIATAAPSWARPVCLRAEESTTLLLL